ncbi:uncharacterized protein LOC110243557 [Exaiptasia diaphana]|uniref:Uncharacterized protein n=1 Tax=Exaiptasia diaphana TaxID=2652724 RepID=A0A913XJR9_EXADI|nr:uncharacterized protein LOC110243557 [Exaiptasia diaphana]
MTDLLEQSLAKKTKENADQHPLRQRELDIRAEEVQQQQQFQAMLLQQQQQFQQQQQVMHMAMINTLSELLKNK